MIDPVPEIMTRGEARNMIRDFPAGTDEKAWISPKSRNLEENRKPNLSHRKQKHNNERKIWHIAILARGKIVFAPILGKWNEVPKMESILNCDLNNILVVLSSSLGYNILGCGACARLGER